LIPARIAVIALVALALGASAAQAMPGYTPPDKRLEMAREEHGDPVAPPRRHDLPAGALTVTPTQLVAAKAGQAVRFTVSLDRAVPGATLHVRLPARWLEVPASRVPAIRAPRLHANAGGRARLRRAGRDVALALDGAAGGATASFDVVDNGIPAGTYELPFRWVDDSTGRTQRAGTAQLRFLAPSREALSTGLSAPGIDRNASNDTLEESESFIAVVPGNKDRLAATINWASSSFPAWITNDGGVTWTGPLSMP
jgi:Spy/CpxP family protein refolding chaperone